MIQLPKPAIVGSTMNYTIEHGARRRTHDRPLAEGERSLGYFILPPFQRPPAWTREQKVRFIESIWLELPLGSYVFNYDHGPDGKCDHWLIDGQQRWSAIIDYVQSEFEVYGGYFCELIESQRRRFFNHPFPCIQTKMSSESGLRDIYDRLAYGGTPHEAP